MFLTAYCLSYGNWTVIPKQWQESFEDMRANGFDAVALSFSESEMQYARRTFQMQIAMAHKCGLKVLAIPSRLGGRFAGAPLMPGLWITDRPDCQMPEHPGVACIESHEFRMWIKQFISTLVDEYEVDGLIWDEPKLVDALSSHPETLARYGENPSQEDMQDSFVEMLGELTLTAKDISRDLSVTMFNMPKSPVYFTQKASRIPGIDYCGFDGNFSRQSFFHEEPQKIKHSLSETWSRTQNECRQANKKTFALIENMLMPQTVHEEFALGLEEFLSYAQPDHLSCYYYAHNNECPEMVHQLTMRILRKYRLKINHRLMEEVATV